MPVAPKSSAPSSIDPPSVKTTACSAMIRDVGLENFKRAFSAFLKLTLKNAKQLAEFEAELAGLTSVGETETVVVRYGFAHLVEPLYKTPRLVRHRHEKIEFLTMVATWKPVPVGVIKLPASSLD